MTILDIAKECSRLLQIPVPAAFVAATSNNQVLLKAIIYKTLQDLRDEYDWPELQRQWLFKAYDNLAAYPLPPDYERRIDETLWNRSQNWPLIGPIDPILWQQYKSGFITTLPRQRFRVKGIDIDQFYIDPAPSSDDNNQQMVFEYITKNSIRPATHTLGSTPALNSYKFYNGQIYQCTTSGATSSVRGPLLTYGGFSRDSLENDLEWMYIPPFAASTYYKAGSFYSNSSNIYKVTTAGVSNVTGPTTTDSDISNGSTVVDFQATPSAWAAGTEYSENDYVSANSKYYICTHDGIAATLSPDFTATTVVDSSCTWTLVNNYPEFTADTDEVLLNNDMVAEGAVWRFLQAQRMAYDDLKLSAEEKVQACKTKLEGAESISVNMRSRYPWAIGTWSYPQGNFGIDE